MKMIAIIAANDGNKPLVKSVTNKHWSST